MPVDPLYLLLAGRLRMRNGNLQVLRTFSRDPVKMAWVEAPYIRKGGKYKKWVGVGEDAGKRPRYQHNAPGVRKRIQEAAAKTTPAEARKKADAAVSGHGGDPSDYVKQQAASALALLRRHHGENAIHRIQELAETDAELLKGDKVQGADRHHLEMRMQAYNEMLQSLDKGEVKDGERTDTGGTGDDGRRADVGGTDGGSARRPRPSGERIVTARADLTKPGNPDLVPEGLRKHLDTHQIQGVAKAVEALDAHGGFLLADGTGVGKTRQELATAATYAQRGHKVLIVTKAEVIKPNWQKKQVTGSFKNDSATMGIDLKLNGGTDPIAAGEVHVSTYDRLSDLKGQIDRNTVVIFDESHSLKNWGSARAKHGYEMGKAAGKVMYATATPADKPLHVAHLFRAKVFGDQPWEDTYHDLGMIQKTIRTPNGDVKKWEIDPRKGAAECYRRMAGLFDKMTEEGLMLKREISFDGVDVGVEKISLGPEVHELMAKIDREVSRSGANPGLAKAQSLMQQRRQQEPYKIPHAVDTVQKELAEGRQCVVFVSRVNESEIKDDTGETVAGSKGTAGLLREALIKAGVADADIGELHGGHTQAKRLKAQDAFQEGKAKVLIATVESGGTGINLDDTVGDKPRTMVMLTAPFSAVENVQAAGRVWRLKTESFPRVKYLFGDTEVDRWNSSLITSKMRALGAAVQGEVEKLDVSLDVSEEEAIEQMEAAKERREAEPFKWRSLTTKRQPPPQQPMPSASKPASSSPSPSKSSISVKRVQTKRGERYVHNMPKPNKYVKELPSYASWSKNLSGGYDIAIWGDSPAEVEKYAADLKRRLGM